MLTITSRQMAAFQDASFLLWLEGHVRHFFPNASASFNGLAPRESLVEGVRRARQYGFISYEDICQYIDIMFAIHPDFDQDDSLPWAKEILNDPDILNPSVRMDLLMDAARDHLGDVTAG